MEIDPYEVIGVTPDATPDEIRARYLALVRENPPEQAPARFAEIRAAYDALRDPVESMRRRLFDTRPHTTLDVLLAADKERVKHRRIATDILLSIGDA